MLPGAPTQPTRVTSFTVAMFTHLDQASWFLLLACTLGFELVPLPASIEVRLTYFGFYSYVLFKLALFFVFGFVTQIAWWKYTTLTLAEVVGIGSTAGVEVGQFFIAGHRASVLELTVKLSLLFAGTIAGLAVRKYQRLHAGPLSVCFTSRYW